MMQKQFFYKLDFNEQNNIPEVTKAITFDKSLHVKLFLFSFPIPLSAWFKTSTCKLKSKSSKSRFSTIYKKL